MRYCPKCKTVSFLRKGACSNRKCDSEFFFCVIFFKATKKLYYVFQPGWQYNARGKDRKKSWEKGNEAEYNQMLERLKGMRTKKKDGPKQLKIKKRSKGKKRRERGERIGLSTSRVPGKHFIFKELFFAPAF